MINGSYSYVGGDALSAISKYNADIAFFSCRGLSDDGIPSDTSIEENDVRRAMIKNAKRKILLCDSKKTGKTYLNNLCMPDEIDLVICDN